MLYEVITIRPMRVDRIQLNTVVRPPAETFALAVSPQKLAAIGEKFQKALGLPVDLPFAPATEPIVPVQPSPAEPLPAVASGTIVQEIIEMLQRRPSYNFV